MSSRADCQAHADFALVVGVVSGATLAAAGGPHISAWPGSTGELYVSEKQGDMSFGTASPIVELNDAAANDIQPNVRKDGREIVFSSNRGGGLGRPDIWSATRASVEDPWSAPINLGSNVNTSLGESRPSLSWDAEQLLFGRAGPAGTGEGGTGMSDIYVTTREKSGE
jgi:Tol biopolymer transport system component